MAPANAALTPKHRFRLARLIVEDGWPPSLAAEYLNRSWRRHCGAARRGARADSVDAGRESWSPPLGPATACVLTFATDAQVGRTFVK
jgi:hypothetical protein